MPKITAGIGWFRDILQVLVLDRLNSKLRPFSFAATEAVRNQKFHAHARIRPLALSEILKMLGDVAADQPVAMPPVSRLAGLGSPAYYYALGAITKAVAARTILEIGTFRGVSAFTFAVNMQPGGQVFTVDLPDDATATPEHELNAQDRGHVESSRFRVGEAFIGSSVADRIRQIRADSMTFKAEERATNADLVLVDGGHSRPLITKDTANAFRVLGAEGVILWDDYFALYPDVVEFLDELSAKHRLFGIQGTNLVAYSPKWQGGPADVAGARA